jgi:hypothetical protein
MGALRSFLAMALLVTFSSTALADSYGKWSFNKEKKRAECVYTYANKSGGTSFNTVLRYGVNDKKVGYDYFLNSKGQCWSKCMNSRNPDFQPQAMQWSLCNPDGSVKEVMDVGDCPTPKDGVNPITEDAPDVKF